MSKFNSILVYLVLGVLCCSHLGYSQNVNRTNNWFFGNEYGLQFTRDNVSLNTNGSIVATEATASISDINGELLFYTDGSKVWNRNHTIMINGTGLHGRRQYSQPALIVPNPENDSIYYIFTIGSFYGDLREGPFNAPAVDHGLNYSIVDFTDNPNGEITQKNVHLLDHTALKMSAIVKCSDNSYWLTTFSTSDGKKGGLYDTFYSFKVGGSGVETNPVTSTTDRYIDDPRGAMKFSPNGKKLAAANVTSRLLIANFDTESGTISSANILSIKDILTFAVAEFPYSIEFSLDSKVLYTGSITDPDNGQIASGLVQYFIGDSETNSIAGNKTILTDNENLFGSGLQLARNGKIYRAYSSYSNSASSYLGVINNPELQGFDSNYSHDAIELSNRFSGQRRSLPNFVPSFFQIENLVEESSESKEISICEDLDYVFSVENIEGAEYIWFKDGIKLENENENTFTLTEVTESDKGHYELVVNPNDGTCSKHKEAFVVEIVKLARMPEGLELKQCRSEVSDQIVFNVSEILNSFEYDPDGTIFNFYDADPELNSNLIPFSQEEIENYFYENGTTSIIYVEATNSLGCKTYQNFSLTVVDASLPNLSDIELCDANDDNPHDNLALFQSDQITTQIRINNNFGNDISFSYFTSYDDALREVNEITEQVIGNNTVYWVRGEKSGSDCLGITQITLGVLSLPKVELDSSDNVICVNPLTEEILNPIVLGRNLGESYSYNWILNETRVISESPVIEANEVGIYKVEITNNVTGCSYFSNEIEVSLSSIPVNDPSWLSIDQSSPFSNINNVSIVARGIGNSTFTYQLDDGPVNDNGIFSNLSTGGHTITITNIEGCSFPLQIAINVIGFPKFFTPNNDGFNDRWNIVDSYSELGQNDVKIYDRYGKMVAKIRTSKDGWDGSYNGKMLRSDDYWFEIELTNGEIYRNHFSLIR